jgi:hypothetical protein
MAKRWNDLTGRQKRLIVIAGTVEAVLKVAMLLDLRRRSAAEVRGSKRWWALGALVNSAGVIPVAYFVVGRRPDGDG